MNSGSSAFHLFRLMLVAGLRNQVAPPQVATFLPVDFAAGTLEHHHVLDAFHVRIFLTRRQRSSSAESHVRRATLHRK